MFEIVEAGDPVLRMVAQPLSPEEILGDSTRALIEMMAEIMRSAPGVGLAAPQIGVSLRVIVIEDRPEYIEKLTACEQDERERRPVGFQALINPRLTVEDREPVGFFEGCLSIPGYQAFVPRARSVCVEALDAQAQPLRIRAAGWFARILQHEVDHLDGILCLDRMTPRSLTSHANYTRHWRERPASEVSAHFDLAQDTTGSQQILDDLSSFE